MIMSSGISDVSWLFPWAGLARICKSQDRIRFFVDREPPPGHTVRQLVDWEEVLAASDKDRAFRQATALDSYARFAALAQSSTQAATTLDDLTASPNLTALGRFLTSVFVLMFVVSLFVPPLPAQLTWVGIIVAIPVAPMAGLAARAAIAGRSAGYLMYAACLSALGIAAVTVPLALGLGDDVVSWLVLSAFLVATWLFAIDHRSRPRLRGVKRILLRQGEIDLETRTHQARVAWLEDALKNAVMPELTQAINALLGPEQEKLLLVTQTDGLRAVYQEDCQVFTDAERRVEEVLRGSEGASIALSGPRGCGKSNTIQKLRAAKEARFSVAVSAPTQYAPKEFLTGLFQALCEQYIKDRGFSVEHASSLVQGAVLIRVWRGRAVQFLRAAIAAALVALVVWDATGRAAAKHIDGMPKWLWTDRPVMTGVILAAAALLIVPKSNWRNRFLRSSEPPLVTAARRNLLRLQAEQTATLQFSGTVPVMQAAFSRAVAQRSLPWTMPELVDRLRDFLAEIAAEEGARRHRKVLICIDEVDRIGSVDEATRFLSEIKAIFGVPHCYFVVAVAQELGLSFSGREIIGRTVADNAFDHVISLDPMTFEMSRELLTRRVPGFTEPFVWLSFVLSGGLPRELLRVARRLAELTIESDYELRLPEFAERLVREEMLEATVAARGQIARQSPGPSARILDRLRLRTRDLQPGVKAADMMAALRDLAELPGVAPGQGSGEPALSEPVARLAALALVGLTTCDMFRDDCYDICGFRDPAARGLKTPGPPGTLGPYAELAAARRELGVSAQSCRTAVEKVRASVGLP